MIKKCTPVLLLLFCTANLYAQDTQQLTYDESLIIATQSSFTFKRQELDFKRDYYNLLRTKAGLKSNAYLSFMTPYFEESIVQEYIPETGTLEFVSSSKLRYNTKLRVSQPLPTGGDFSLNLEGTYLNQKGYRQYFGKLYLEFSQPILKPNELKNNIEKAEMKLEQTRLSYAQSKAGSISWLTGRFFNMFRLQEQIKNNEEMVTQYQEAFKLAEERKNRGELAENELLILQVDLENIQSNLVKLRNDLQNGEEQFRQQVGIDKSRHVEVVADIDFQPVAITLDDAIEIGVKNRVEIVRSQLSLRQQELDFEKKKSEGKLTGEIVIRFGFDNHKEFLEDILKNYLDSQNIIFKFKLPLLDWGRNEAELDVKRMSMEKTKNYQVNQSRQIVKEITDSYNKVAEALGRLAILRASQEDSERSYALTFDQFNANESTAQNLRLARERLINNKDRYLNAFVAYQQALADMNRTTMWDFQNNRPLVTDEEIEAIVTALNNNDNNEE